MRHWQFDVAVADRQGEAISLDTLGLVAQFRGDTRQASEQYEEALAIQRVLNDQRSQAYTLTHLALLAEDTGDLDAAASGHEKALAIRTRGSSHVSAATDNLAGLARVALARGDLSEALRQMRRSRTCWLKREWPMWSLWRWST